MEKQTTEVGTTMPQSEQEAQTPKCLNKFNVGAFFFGWFWGACNRVWIALIGLIPIVNIVMMFVLGFKGNQWAWEQQKDYTAPEDFDESQSKWANAGWIFFVITASLGILQGAMS